MRKTKKQIEEDNRRVAVNISYYMAFHHVSEERCALALNVCLRTFQRRMEKPGTFSLDDLSALANLLNTTSQMLQFGKLEADGVA